MDSWNAGAKRFKGYEPNEILGKHFSVFYRQEDVDAGLCDRELEEAAREGRFEDEGWRVRKGGSLFWASVVITALYHPQTGELVGFAKVTRDLTDKRRAEAERLRLAEEAARREAAESDRRDAEEQREKAESAVRAREHMLAIVSHDLRNPLGTVLLRAQQIAHLADESVVGIRTEESRAQHRFGGRSDVPPRQRSPRSGEARGRDRRCPWSSGSSMSGS